MSRNNTGNPLGSKAFLDLEDNVKNLDEAVNSEEVTWTDRFGKTRKTLSSISSDAEDWARQAQHIAIGDVIGDDPLQVPTNESLGAPPRTVGSIAELRALRTFNRPVVVAGYYAPGDGGGVFAWEAADVADDNGGTVIRPDDRAAGVPGRWRRLLDGGVTPLMFGAWGDGVADDTDALQRTLSAGVRRVDGLGRTYRVSALVGRSNLHFTDARLIKIGSDKNHKNVLDFESLDAAKPISRVLLERIYIDGRRGEETGLVFPSEEDGGRSGFRFRGYIDGVTLQDCSANFCATDGLLLFSARPEGFGAKNIRVIDCEFNYNRRHGMSADSLKNVEFVRVTANHNGLTIDGETDITRGNYGATLGEPDTLYGNGIDIETYGPNQHSVDVVFRECEMLGNARGGVLMLEKKEWNGAGYSPWRRITFEGGRYDKGVHHSSQGQSIILTPNTAAYTPGARKVFVGVRIVGTDLVDGSVLFRYAEDVFIQPAAHSGSVPPYIVQAIGDSRATVSGIAADKVFTDQGASVQTLLQAPALAPPGISSVTVATGAGTLTVGNKTLLLHQGDVCLYWVQTTYTPSKAGEKARLTVYAGFSGQAVKVIGGGVTDRSNGLLGGEFGAVGASANVQVAVSVPVDVGLFVLIHPAA